MKEHAFRLHKGDLLKESLQEYCVTHNIQSAILLSGVGSLEHIRIRLAEAVEFLEKDAHYEIVSLMGTLSIDGVHLHISVSDKEGRVWGGHLSDGCVIYTTAEIVLGELEDYHFTREMDESTGYKELVVREK